MKRRLDEILVERELAASRSQAKALIMSGRVLRGTERLDKPGKVYPDDIELIVEQPPRFVSRGGEKLRGFLDKFPVDLTGADILDVGASTGGFTDCALQAGAASSVCIDVGRAQLHAKLLGDSRVTNIEKINARSVSAEDLPRAAYDAVVMDLSFISLRKVLPAVWPLVKAGGILIALIKPQFEAGKAAVDKGQGIIRDAILQEQIRDDLVAFAQQELCSAEVIGTIDSPIVGTDGNREFLMGLRRS